MSDIYLFLLFKRRKIFTPFLLMDMCQKHFLKMDGGFWVVQTNNIISNESSYILQ